MLAGVVDAARLAAETHLAEVGAAREEMLASTAHGEDELKTWASTTSKRANTAANEAQRQLDAHAASLAADVATAADELIDYNYAGEWTPLFITSYLGLTLAYTGIAFVSYLVLTKLKII